jgi:hypothetical protein
MRIDATNNDGNNERRGSGGSATILVTIKQSLGVVWNEHSKEEDENHIEKEDTIEGKLDGSGDISAGVRCLPS